VPPFFPDRPPRVIPRESWWGERGFKKPTIGPALRRDRHRSGIGRERGPPLDLPTRWPVLRSKAIRKTLADRLGRILLVAGTRLGSSWSLLSTTRFSNRMGEMPLPCTVMNGPRFDATPRGRRDPRPASELVGRGPGHDQAVVVRCRRAVCVGAVAMLGVGFSRGSRVATVRGRRPRRGRARCVGPMRIAARDEDSVAPNHRREWPRRELHLPPVSPSRSSRRNRGRIADAAAVGTRKRLHSPRGTHGTGEKQQNKGQESMLHGLYPVREFPSIYRLDPVGQRECRRPWTTYPCIWRSMSAAVVDLPPSASLPPAIRNVLTAGIRICLPVAATPRKRAGVLEQRGEVAVDPIPFGHEEVDLRSANR